ncbi:MAG TPA: signal peptide peptidase SppA [Pirellulales bacterium]|jgi:protease-4|nr:signal peptide peptidase SppA [Pirellulales bacterium]
MHLRRIGYLAVVCVFLATRLAGAADEKAASDKSEKAADKSKSKLTLASFMLDESYPEGPTQPGIFGEMQPNLGRLMERMNKAADDDKIYGIVIHINDADLGRGKVDELRAVIAHARKAGKKVYADLYETRSAGYLLACACDQIIMPPVSELTVSGVRLEITYFKGLLDKLGIKADMLQMGDYKGADEPLTREKMSPEFRGQTEKVVDDYYQQLVEIVSTERKLDAGKVKDVIDEGLFTADRAKEVGLIDQVAYLDEFRKDLAQKQHVEEVVLAEDYGKQQLEEEDMSGFAGFMKMFELISGGEPRGKASSAQKIAVVYCVGEINTGESKGGMMSERLGSETIIKALRDAEKDSKVVGIVLRVDSPGGSAMASDLMWREITRIKAKKPIVASMGDIAASGGYYISMGCNKIFAEPGTLTGSIGVVGGKLALKGLFDKIGISTDSISRGKNNGWMSSEEPFSDSEREVIMRSMKDCYRQFTEKAAQGRNLSLKDLESLAGGRLYSGRMAKQSKLVDELGTLDDAVNEAKKLAGLKGDEKVERLLLPKPRSFLEELMGGPLMQSEAKFLPSSSLSVTGQLLKQISQAEALVQLFSEPAVYALPFEVHVK